MVNYHFKNYITKFNFRGKCFLNIHIEPEQFQYILNDMHDAYEYMRKKTVGKLLWFISASWELSAFSSNCLKTLPAIWLNWCLTFVVVSLKVGFAEVRVARTAVGAGGVQVGSTVVPFFHILVVLIDLKKVFKNKQYNKLFSI